MTRRTTWWCPIPLVHAHPIIAWFPYGWIVKHFPFYTFPDSTAEQLVFLWNIQVTCHHCRLSLDAIWSTNNAGKLSSASPLTRLWIHLFEATLHGKITLKFHCVQGSQYICHNQLRLSIYFTRHLREKTVNWPKRENTVAQQQLIN